MVDKDDDKKKSKHSTYEEDHEELEDYDFSEDIDEDFSKSGDFYKKQAHDSSDEFQKIHVKDKAISFFKENIIYLLIILFLIVPGILMFKNKFFKSEKPRVAVEQTSTEPNPNLQFSSSTGEQTAASQRTPEVVALQQKETTQTLPVEEYQVPQSEPQSQPEPQPQLSTVPATSGIQSFDTTAMTEELATIKEHLSQLDARFAQLEESLQSLSLLKNLPTISAKIDALEKNQIENAATKQDVEKVSNNINRLGTVVNQLSRTIYQRNLTETASERVSIENAASQDSDFVVHAVIPGRAWLRNPDGALVSVQVGDIMPGYGKVVAIDPHNGTVKMSSNHIFKEDTNH